VPEVSLAILLVAFRFSLFEIYPATTPAETSPIAMTAASHYFGLTGGIATGKSTVARMFEELGARVIDADRIGHELILKPQPAYEEIVRAFGRDVLNSSNEIDRQRLGVIVFAEPAKLAQLNAILHPRIIARTEELARELIAREPGRVILVDAALIFEAGIGGRFKKVIVTWCPPKQQLERLMAKGLSREEAERRVTAQMSAEEKRRRADFVIDTSGTQDQTRKQVPSVFAKLQRLAAKR
jgi:dephospho-CoA kinase